MLVNEETLNLEWKEDLACLPATSQPCADREVHPQHCTAPDRPHPLSIAARFWDVQLGAGQPAPRR